MDFSWLSDAKAPFSKGGKRIRQVNFLQIVYAGKMRTLQWKPILR